VMPFDRISRSVLVATANPFDDEAKDPRADHAELQRMWYVAAPAEILALCAVPYGLDNHPRKA